MINGLITTLWESPMSSNREEDRRSVLATIDQLRGSLVLSAHDEEAAQAVAAGLRDAKAANTTRVYTSAWHEFNVWALANGRQSLPAEPQTVALHFGRLAADGKAMATIEQARAAISHAHAAEGTAKGDNPPAIRSWPRRSRVGGIRPQHPGKAAALTADALARARETARLPRRGRAGRMESVAWAKTSPDTTAASAWRAGWWPQERRPQWSSTKGDGSTATWPPGTPGARPQRRR